MKEILKKAIEEQKGFHFENAGMALDHICMALFCRYDIMATYKNRSIYCGDKRVASIEFKKNDYGDLVIHEYHII